MLKLLSSRIISRRTLSSALYLTGDKAREQFAVLVPYLDFGHKLGDFESLQRNVRLRQYPIDCETIRLQWELYRDVEKRKRDIERSRTELQKRIQQSTDEEEKNVLKAHAVRARDDLKMLKERSYAIADSFIANNFLAIPNDLHARTPEEEAKVLHEKSPPTLERLDLARETSPLEDQFEQFGASCLYMTGDAAWMDLRLPMHCCETFQTRGHILFSNPDFVRTFLLEAAMVPKESLYLVREDDEPEDKVNLLHLCGGGSLLGFLGYFTKLSVFPSVLPLRLVASGKRYHFEQTQSNEVHVFGACKSPTEAEQIFDDMVQLCQKFYDRFPVGYRIVQVAAPELRPAESMRIDVQLYDVQGQRYVKVADLCYYSDFLSKRIAFIYQDGKTQKFPHIVAGQVMSSVELIKLLLRNKILLTDLPFLDEFGLK